MMSKRIFLTILLCLCVVSCMNQSVLEKKIIKIDQDPSHYITANQKTLKISNEQLSQLKKTFLTLYFSPWDNNETATTTFVLQKVQKDYDYYLQNPGFSFNAHTFSKEDIKKLTDNGSLEDYPNINQPGIVLSFTSARIMPTLLPSYNDPSLAGEGYPFDNWIASLVAPGTPVRILQQSKDKVWYLIKTPSFYGWVPSETVALVDAAFIQEWQKYPFLVALQDNVPLVTENGTPVFSMRIGMLYPNPETKGVRNQVLMPVLGAQGYAQTISVFADSSATHAFPIEPTAENIASLAQNFIGSPYGWGGLYQLRDCSATTHDLLANFGFWLPRNSLQQAQVGDVISLAGKKPSEKKRIILDQGVPFFSLIHFPGHVALYIGDKSRNLYIFQEMWGLKTTNFLGQESRAIYGRTGITTLTLTKGYLNAKNTQLEAADALVILNPDSYSDPQAILNKIWTAQPPTKK